MHRAVTPKGDLVLDYPSIPESASLPGTPERRRRCLNALLLAVAGACLGSPALAQVPGDASSLNALNKMSLKQLANVEVTSVSKEPQKLLQAASAIQVITSDEIRRSGATSLPQALRLA
ncbi:MAG: hypothetical protein ACRESR_03660, partial [Gammaproteobacteria bacterium]